MELKRRWAPASPACPLISRTMIACLLICAGLHVETLPTASDDTTITDTQTAVPVPPTENNVLSTVSPQTSSFNTNANATSSVTPSKETTVVSVPSMVSIIEKDAASQSSTTHLSTSFTEPPTLPVQTITSTATDKVSPTQSDNPVSAISATNKTEQPASAESPSINSTLSLSTVPSSTTETTIQNESSTEHSVSVNTDKENTTYSESTTASINSTNVTTVTSIASSSQSTDISDRPPSTAVENTATSQKSADVAPPETKPPSIVGTPVSTKAEEQRALSPGGVAAVTIVVIAIVLVIFGGAAFWKIRRSSYGRLLEDQDYGSLGNYNNPLYDDS